ncbi:hypothetical protein GCM10023149_32730 [Mucilaginibacter gynuensis]|uniref:Prevent-host-death family protein n=2 Tax=Mucilaginibacter gynuensis TaxID=1302236 RepID=A0ABP8GR92_9SPHI
MYLPFNGIILLNYNVAIQFITDNKGKRTAAIIPIHEYENMLHRHHLDLELIDEYKQMIDKLLEEEANGTAKHISVESIKERFLK